MSIQWKSNLDVAFGFFCGLLFFSDAPFLAVLGLSALVILIGVITDVLISRVWK